MFRCRVCSSILLALYMHSIMHSEPSSQLYMHACSGEGSALLCILGCNLCVISRRPWPHTKQKKMVRKPPHNRAGCIYNAAYNPTSIKTMKLKDEARMAGSKSTQTRFVVIITFTIHPYTCFFRSSHAC